MPIRDRVLAAVTLLLVVVLAGGCSWAFGSSDSSGHSDATFTDNTSEKTHVYGVREGMSRVSLDLDISVGSGTVGYRLTGPNGETIWEGQVDAGDNLTASRDISPVAGDYTLTFTLTAATGHYQADWEAD